MDLLFSLLLAILNGRRAQQKGLKGLQWGVYTFLLFMLFEIVSGAFVMLYFYKGALTPDAVTAYLISHPIHTFFMWFCGLGGYLLMRYRIDKIAAQRPPQDDIPEDLG